MSILSQVSCFRVKSGEPAATDAEIAVLYPFVPSWRLIREDGVRKLRNRFVFDNDRMTEGFLRHLERISAEENHHPEIVREGDIVTVDWWTHSIGDLHPNDFLMAAKAEGAYTTALVGGSGNVIPGVKLPGLHELSKFRDFVSWRLESERVPEVQ